jgi:Capsule polysaccharide biosynthesis protein
MTIRLLAVSTAANTDAALQALLRQAGGEIELALHLGNSESDYKASAVSRMNLRRGKRGHLTEGTRYAGLAHALFMQDDYDALVDDFVDHLQRRAEPYAYLSHPLRGFHEYWDYFHVLADVIAQRIADSGATHALFFNVPHLVHDTLVWQVTRAMGLPTLIVSQSLFPNRFISMPTIEAYGRLRQDADAQAAPPYPIQRGETLQHFYMKGIAQHRQRTGRLTWRAIVHLMGFLLTKRRLQALNPLYVVGLLKRMQHIYGGLPDWRDPFARFFHENSLDYFEHLLQFEDVQPDWSRRFVYFPLQLQPEMTTSALGGPFKDQALAIESLARMLPEDVAIYVKENPKQGAFQRGPMFFHRLRRIPNLVFMASHTSTHELTARCEFVASISGTVGWEAVRQGKPALVFGSTWYADLPGVHRWREGLRFEDIMAAPPDHDALERVVGQFLHHCHEGIVERHYKTLVPDFDEARNAEQVGAALHALLSGRTPTTFA